MKNKKIRAIIVLSILFIINFILVVTNNTSVIDTFVRDKVFSLYGEVMNVVMRIFTTMACTPFVVGFALAFFVIMFIKKKKRYGFSLAGCLVVSTLINNIIKFIVRRPRPVYMSIIENTYSYPSGHTMGAATLYGFLIYLLLRSNINKKYKVIYSIILVFIILMVATSRIYFGAHYFSDIFGGLLLSSILIISFSLINDKKHLL